MSEFVTAVSAVLLRFAETPEPVPSDLASPGPWGFTVTFLVAVAAVLIIYDMIRRVRRINYRADVKRKIEEETAIDGNAPDVNVPGGSAPDGNATTEETTDERFL